MRRGKGVVPFSLCLVPFVLLATANSAGYRYGASDLAFYGPVVMRNLDRQLFPRDRPVIDAQSGLTLMDETVGTLARLTTTDLPVLFFILYLVSLILIAAAAAAIGSRLFRSPWTTCGLLMALTLRHAIARSGTNTLEGYFHPRQLAFGFGAIAIAAFLRGRTAGTVAALTAAALLHPTTTLWFVVWLGTALLVSLPRWRVVLAWCLVLACLAVWWAVAAGPLGGRFVTMDAEWLQALGEKEYLFPGKWPASAWAVNLGYVAVIWTIHRQRARAGLLAERETALVVGICALVVTFLVGAILNAAGLALAIQLQPARVFWLLDFLAIVYIVWAAAEGGRTRKGCVLQQPVGRPAIVAGLLLIASIVRGVYVMRVEFPERPLFETSVPGDWGRVMAWARATAKDTGWLADPNHASMYGTSVRMAAGRDVFVEAVKDTAIGMYDRRIALRTRERLNELNDFRNLSPEAARELGTTYQLDYIVTERDLALPLTFASGPLRVYHLR